MNYRLPQATELGDATTEGPVDNCLWDASTIIRTPLSVVLRVSHHVSVEWCSAGRLVWRERLDVLFGNSLGIIKPCSALRRRCIAFGRLAVEASIAGVSMFDNQRIFYFVTKALVL